MFPFSLVAKYLVQVYSHDSAVQTQVEFWEFCH